MSEQEQTIKAKRVGKKASYLAYQNSGRKAANKIRKLMKHLKKHPNDIQSTTKEIVSYKRKGV